MKTDPRHVAAVLPILVIHMHKLLQMCEESGANVLLKLEETSFVHSTGSNPCPGHTLLPSYQWAKQTCWRHDVSTSGFKSLNLIQFGTLQRRYPKEHPSPV